MMWELYSCKASYKLVGLTGVKEEAEVENKQRIFTST